MKYDSYYPWFYSLEEYNKSWRMIAITPLNWMNNILGFFRWLKWCLQRGFRGYADCDVWAINYYLAEIIPLMLQQLKKTHHGVPCRLCEKEDSGDTEEASAKWEKILDEITECFQAAIRIDDEDYGANYLEKLEKDKKLFEKGMKLLTEYYFELWD